MRSARALRRLAARVTSAGARAASSQPPCVAVPRYSERLSASRLSRYERARRLSTPGRALTPAPAGRSTRPP